MPTITLLDRQSDVELTFPATRKRSWKCTIREPNRGEQAQQVALAWSEFAERKAHEVLAVDADLPGVSVRVEYAAFALSERKNV